MVRAALLAWVAVFWAAAAQAADQPTYAAAPPAWVKAVEIPAAPSSGADGAPAQVLLDQVQSQLSPAGDAAFVEKAVKVLTPEGLGVAGAVSETWDPDTEDLTIHWVRVIRGGQVIDALAGGKKLLVLRRENKLELAMLDGRLTATMQPEGLQVGDVIDFAYTITRHDAALGGHSEAMDRLDHTGVAERVYWRALWSAATPVRWRSTEGVPAPTIRKGADGAEFVVDMRGVTAPKPPAGAPPRFYDLGSVEFSGYGDWSQLSKQLSPVWDKATTLQANSALQAEVAKIAAASRDPKVRAMAALRLVEDGTRYVFLGMNDGGLVPAEADSTWARRFGDCKGKTALLVAMLRALGVSAEPVLVNTTFGDGLDQRLPMAVWFDHAIVRAEIGGRTYWLDGTRTGDRTLEDLDTPGYYWALPIRDAGGPLIRMQPEALEHPGAEEQMSVDASKGADAPAPTHLQVTYHGKEAAQQRATIASQPRSDYERWLREFWTKAYPWLVLDKVTTTDDPEHGTLTLTADGVGHLEWSPTSGGFLYRIPLSALGDNVSFKREPGPHLDAPYAVSFPEYTTYSRRYTLPTDGDFTLIGADIDTTVAGVRMQRRSRIEGGVLTIESSVRSVVSEFPASEAEAAGAALRDLSRRDVAIGYRVRSAQAAPAEAPPRLAKQSLGGGGSLGAVQAKAEGGSPEARYHLAEMYAAGQGVPYDQAKALALYRQAADAGYAPAEEAIGAFYARGAMGLARDYPQALDWLGRAVAKGNPAARAELAGMYLFGWGVPKDAPRAYQLAFQAARDNDRVGQFFLGLMYARGEGVLKSEDQAADWMRRAADQDLPPAQAELARAYYYGQGVPKDHVQAGVWARKGAQHGDPDAALILAVLTEHGDGVARDEAEAVRWYRLAADKGDAHAQYALGRMLYQGAGAPKDVPQAFEYLRKAADAGVADAEYAVGYAMVEGDGLPIDYDKGVAYLTHSSSQGNMDAVVAMGALYTDGVGVHRNRTLAMGLFNKAAAANNTFAMVSLGTLYEAGVDAAPDNAQALAWYRKAADAGDLAGKANVGRMYLFGLGVARDDAQALALIRPAADGGNRRAIYLLAWMYLNGRGVAHDEGQAFALFTKAAERGDLDAAAGLGRCYRDGVGVGRDTVKAVDWLTKAAKGGRPSAEFDLGMMYLRGQGVGADRAQAITWLQRAADAGYAPARQSLATLEGHAAAGGVPAPPVVAPR